MQVKNESRVNFKYRASKESPIITKTIFSNVVSTTIVKDTLLVKKTVNKSQASIYDVLFYTIEITNISKNIVNNIVLKDYIPIGTKFINNTLSIDGIIYRCSNPEEGIFIGSIPYKDKIIVSFKVVVKEISYHKNLKNFSIVTFDYIYNIEKPPCRVPICSNEVVTEVKDNLFKQISVKSNINIPNLKGSIDYLIGVETKVKIIDAKIRYYIVDPKVYNGIFIGILIYKIYYIYKGKLCNFEYNQGFSTNILVPKGVRYFNSIKVKVHKEDTTYIHVNKSKLFIVTNLLVKIGY